MGLVWRGPSGEKQLLLPGRETPAAAGPRGLASCLVVLALALALACPPWGDDSAPPLRGPFLRVQVWLPVRGTAWPWTMDGVPSGTASSHFRGDFALGLGVAAAIILSEQNLLTFEDKHMKNGRRSGKRN